MVSRPRIGKYATRLHPLERACRHLNGSRTRAHQQAARIAIIAAALLLAFAPLSVALQEPLSGDEAATRFLELGEILDPRNEESYPTNAAEYASLLPGVAKHLQEQEQIDTQLLTDAMYGYSRLIERDGDWSKDLFQGPEYGLLRELCLREEYGDWASEMDLYTIDTLVRMGRWEDAENVVSGSMEAFLAEPSKLAHFQAIRADIRRLQGDWAGCAALLDGCDELIERTTSAERDTWFFDARCRTYGVRGQLEMRLGRLDLAWVALGSEKKWARLYERASAQAPYEQQRAAFNATLSSAVRLSNYFLVVDRHKEAVAELAPFLDRVELEVWDRGNVLLDIGFALAGDDMGKPLESSESRTSLLQALAIESISSDQRVQAELLLAHLCLLASTPDLIAAAEFLASAETIAIKTDENPGVSSQREITYMRALECALARATFTSAEGLSEALSKLETELDLLIESWGNVPSDPGGVGILNDGRRRVILDEYIEMCFALDQPNRALTKLLEAQAKGSLARELNVEIPSLQTIQKSLAEQGGILVYLPTVTHTQLLVIDATGIQLLRLPSEDKLRIIMREWEFALLVERDTAPVLTALAKALLPPEIRVQIDNWTHVYLLGADLMGHPPFESLPYGEGTLGSEVAGAYLPSLPVGVFLAQRAVPATAPTPGALSLFAGAPPSQEARTMWPRLVDIVVEDKYWDRLTSSFPGSLSKSYLNERATRSALFQQFGNEHQARTGNRVLNLFCHGVFDDQALFLPAGLVLAPDRDDPGLLWCQDITDKIAAPQLVIVAACGAARGPDRLGEDGISNIGGAFLRAGSNAVVLARRPLEVAATLRTSELLHAGLADGLSLAEALRRTRKVVTEERGDADLVSPLFAYGVAHRPLFLPQPSRSKNTMWLALAGLALLVPLAARMRRRAKAS